MVKNKTEGRERTKLWRWTIKNRSCSSIFPLKLRHKLGIRASRGNSGHWTLKAQIFQYTESIKVTAQMTNKVVFLTVVPWLTWTDLDWKKKLEQRHCLKPCCNQITKPLQPPNVTHGKDTDTTGQSGQKNKTTLVQWWKVRDTSVETRFKLGQGVRLGSA